VLENFQAKQAVPLAQIERAILVFLDDQPEHHWTVIITQQPYDPVRLLTASGARPGADIVTVSSPERTAYVLHRGMAYYFVNQRVLVSGSEEMVERCMLHPDAAPPDGSPARAWREHKTDHIVAVLSSAAMVRAAVPTSLFANADDYAALFSLRHATFRARLGRTLQANLSARFMNEAAAKAAAQALRSAHATALQWLERFIGGNGRRAAYLQKLVQPLVEPLRQLPINQQGPDIEVHCRVEGGTSALALGLLAPLARQWHDANAKQTTAISLSLLVRAMYDYQDEFGHFPPAVVCKDGRPLYSWRVALLPALGCERLYELFHHDEPWDSPHNQQLLPFMPAIFAPAAQPAEKKYTTPYQVFVGPGAPFAKDRAPRLVDFSDGLDNTLLIAEAAEPVPWTKPDDIAFALDGPRLPLGGQFRGGFFAARADGSVVFISHAVAAGALRALITPAGGEPMRPQLVPPPRSP
jgi:hypothetical protein